MTTDSTYDPYADLANVGGDPSGSSDSSGIDWSGYGNLSSPELQDLAKAIYGNEVDAGAVDFSGYGSLTPDELKSLAKTVRENTSPTFGQQITDLAKSLGTQGFSKLKSMFTKKDANGNDVIDWAALGTAGVGIYSLFNQSAAGQTGGYNKPVPKMDLVRQQVQYNDPNRRPGSSGRQYFTDPQFVAKGDAAALDAAKTAAATQAAGLATLPAAPPPAANPYAGKFKIGWNAAPEVPAQPTEQVATLPVPTAQQVIDQGGIKMAHGGIANLAAGGRYLAGATDGMADKINTSIDDKQAAKLSHGEFVIPADVVSHLGNGNSDAGAQKLYQMMARVRKARTGNPEQGKRINPDKYMPGGIVGYAGGGAIRFDTGGSTGTTDTTSSGSTGSGGIAPDVSKTSTLSPWVGDYVTNALGQASALASAPYQSYGGPLTSGASDLQQQAFAGASDLAKAGYDPTRYNAGLFSLQDANRYMNPYLQASLDPQLQELQRQNKLANMQSNAQAVKAGAFGGSRQALMNTENQRNMLDKMSNVIGQGYNTAYNNAMTQFNADQQRQMDAQKATEASRQYSADYGLKSLTNLANLGATQRDIEQQGIDADKAEFEKQREWAYKMPQYQLSLLSGLPIGNQTTSTDPGALAKIQSDIAGLASLYKTLSDLGVKPAT